LISKVSELKMFLPNDVMCIIQEKLYNQTCPFYTNKDVLIDVNNFKKELGLSYDNLNISKHDTIRRLDLKSNNYDNAKMIQHHILVHTRQHIPKSFIESVLPLSQNDYMYNVVTLFKNKGVGLEKHSDINMDTFLFVQKYGTYECKKVETLKHLKYGNVGVSLRCRRDEKWDEGFMFRAGQIMNNTPNRSGWVHLLLLEGCVKFIISSHSSTSDDGSEMLALLSNMSYMRGAIYEKAQAFECYGDSYDKYDDILDTSHTRSLSDIDNEINKILLVRSLVI